MWVGLFREKSEAFEVFSDLWSLLIAEKGQEFDGVSQIRSDHGTKFENSEFNSFGTRHGIKHEFSAPKTLQQNGVVERKNRVVQKMAHVMFHSKNIPQQLWCMFLIVCTSGLEPKIRHMKCGLE